jgi:hypothetical protein
MSTFITISILCFMCIKDEHFSTLGKQMEEYTVANNTNLCMWNIRVKKTHFYILRNYSPRLVITIIITNNQDYCDNQGPDFDDMSSFFPLK